MSLNVLIIAEDYRHDQYVLKPVVQSLLSEVGRGNANVQICKDPMIGGVEEALDENILEDVVLTNPQVDLYLLVVDRDGEERDKSKRLQAREQDVQPLLRDPQILFGEQAHQEVEVWLLAGQDDLPTDWNWKDVRDEPDPKEMYFNAYVEEKGLRNSPGKGRKRLGEVAGRNYRTRVRQLCDEVRKLEDRVADFIS